MLETYILVTEDGDSLDLRIFGDLDWLLGHIEPPEVLAGAYKVFDSAGRMGRLEARHDRWEVALVGWEDVDEDEFRRLVLKALKPSEAVEMVDLNLQHFVAALRERVPLYRRPNLWRSRLPRWLRRRPD
jgi:hypothetical protein